MLCYASSFKKWASLLPNRPALLGEERKPAGLSGFLRQCTCSLRMQELVDHTLHAQSTGANGILCKIQDFTVAKDFSGEASCDGEVLWNIIGNAHYFKLLLWNSKRYPCHVSLQATSKTLCRGHYFYFEKDHRSSQLLLFAFGLLVNLVLNLGTTKLFEPDFPSIFLAPAEHNSGSHEGSRVGIQALQHAELQGS